MAGKSVRLTLNFKRELDGMPVFFKSDGQRFLFTHTIKFHQDETYRVDVTVRPAVPIEYIRLQDEKLNLESMTKFIDPNALSYTGIWKTSGFKLTEKNTREQLKLTVGLQKSVTFLASLQCKFYENTEVQHARWGDKLTFVEFECLLAPDGTLTVQKQQYA